MASLGRTVYLGLAPEWDASAPSSTLALTPNAQAARVLGAHAWTIDDLALLRLSRAGIGVAPPYLAHRLLCDAIHEAIDPADVEGTTRSLRPTLNALFRANADLDVLMSDSSPRVQALGRIARIYHDRLWERRLVDRAEALRVATALGRQTEPVLIYGYPRLGTSELAFVDAIAGPASRIDLPWADHPIFEENCAAADYLESKGWTVVKSEREGLGAGERLARSFLGQNCPADLVHAYVFPTLEAEVRGILAQVKACLVDGLPPSDIVVVARDDSSYGPAALAIADEYELPLRALYAVPLAETRVGTWLRLALQVAAGDFPFEPTLQLLGHPFGPGIAPKAWISLRRRRPGGIAGWARVDVDLSPFVWPARASRAAFVDRLRVLLETFDVRQKAASWAGEMLAFQELLENLTELNHPAEESLPFTTFAREVGELLALLTVPAEPGRGGVELHTPLSLFGARYRRVFLLGLAEGVFPQPVQDDPGLDFHDRIRLRAKNVVLEIPVEASRREQLSFVATLLATTEQLTVSYSQLRGDKEGLPSPFLGALGFDRDLPAPPTFVASLDEARRIALQDYLERNSKDDPITRQAYHAWRVERRREGSDAPDEYDGVIAEPIEVASRTFSANQLVTIGQCAFKWFAQQLLHLAEPDEAAPDLAMNTRGELYHKTIDLALAAARDATDVRTALLAGLDDAFHRAEKALDLPPLPAWTARRVEHLQNLRRAVASAEFLDPNADILRSEGTFQGEWHGLSVTGRIDRLDRTPDGLVLVDYKTSSKAPPGAKDDKGDAKLDVQLPLYRQVAAPFFQPGQPVAGAFYFSLTRGVRLKGSPVDDSALAALAERVKEHLRGGSYPVAPDNKGEACKFCPYDLLCRRGPRLERKAAQPG